MTRIIHVDENGSGVLAGIKAATRLTFVVALAFAGIACTPSSELNLAAPTPTTELGEAAISFAATNQSTPVSSRRATAARKEQVVSDQYYIEFRARSALSYGHTFASVGRLNRDGSIATTEIVGLHPATESSVPWMIGHFVPVPSETGASDGDTEEIYWTARHRVVMDKARYDELMANIRELQRSSPVWHAVFYNCNAFIGDIVKQMGMKAPANTMLFPKDYIDELRSLNN